MSDDLSRFLRGELTDPERAADILLAADSDPLLSLCLDLFVPIPDTDTPPPTAPPMPEPRPTRRPRT